MTKMIVLNKLLGFLIIGLLGNLTLAIPEPQITAVQTTAVEEVTATQTVTPLITATNIISPQDNTLKPIKTTTPCFTYTSTVPYQGPIAKYCPIDPRTCPPHILCIEIKTESVKVPCPTIKCPKTPTVTVTGPSTCPTCVVGCDKSTTTVLVTPPCPKITLF